MGSLPRRALRSSGAERVVQQKLEALFAEVATSNGRCSREAVDRRQPDCRWNTGFNSPSGGRKLYISGQKMKLNDVWQRPLLDDFLRRIRLRTCVCFRSEFRSPWGISVARRRAIFHIVQHGNCWLQIGAAAQPTRLSEGEVAVFPRGDSHTLRDAPSTPTVDFFGLVNTAVTG